MIVDVEKVKLLMAEKELSITALMGISGVSAQRIGIILRRGTCRPATAGKLARGLGVPVKDIIILEEV